MKSKKYFVALCSVCLLFVGCDKDFVEINSNPYVIGKLNPGNLFANAVRQTDPGSWEVEQTITQQFVNAYNLGATAGPNFNTDADNFNQNKWNNVYPNSIKLLVQAIELAQNQPERVNLMSMMRIWKAYVFMTLTDTYADVPYFDAGKAAIDGNFRPVYDDDEAIYTDLYNEIKSATDALDPAADFVSNDLIYPTATTAALQVPLWKKLGNSLLLRLGMRYSKVDPTLAQTRVVEAVSRGVMQTNADNAYLTYASATYNNPMNNGPRAINTYFYYVAEPFVDYLKATNDPRAKYMIGIYANPTSATTTTPDVTLANQFGFPVGFDNSTIQDEPSYRGAMGGGMNYSQLNFNVLGNATAPVFYVTNSQVKLLLAEATKRGWISSEGTVQELYEEGIRASMDDWAKFPNTTAIPSGDQDAYLAETDVAFDDTRALELINTQYWVSNVANGPEVWANFRRSGFPVLSRNTYNDNLIGNGSLDGFIHRIPYPNGEALNNEENFFAADAAIGGDNLVSRVFWDVP
ncbi:MAG: SusD/RagB family nutrient-binding outer membrane lipoprotein [Chryseolinea sp.]